MMSEETSAWVMIGLDILMICYSLWVFSLKQSTASLRFGIATGLGTWLIALHLGLSTKHLFPEGIEGGVFLGVIVLFVGMVGTLLIGMKPLRRLLLELDQQQLLLLQGIRVFFGATFLMQASLGVLPTAFGIVDGFTHISAGFLGLIAAFAFASGCEGNRRAWFANVFGLMDILVVASSLSLVLLPTITPHHSMMYAVFLPAPLWLWFHLISIWKLLRPQHNELGALPATQAAHTAAIH